MFDFLLSHAVRRVQNANHVENSCYNLYVVSLTFESPETKFLKTLRKKYSKHESYCIFKYTNSICIIAEKFCKYIEMLKEMYACLSHFFKL